MPAIGNNDCYYHDFAPYVNNATDYYTELKTIFFDEVPANTALAANQTFLDSWMTGGYYHSFIDDNVMVITLNGIYPFTNNDIQITNGTDLMFTWLTDLMAANPDVKFMTQVHVFFGFNYYMGQETFWYEQFTN